MKQPKSKRSYSFKQFLDDKDKALTDNFEAPKFLVQPAEGDKGFALVKAAFDSEKSFKFVPKISF